MVSRFKVYDSEIIKHLKEPNPKGAYEISKLILKGEKREDEDGLGKYISRNGKSLLDDHEGIYAATNEIDVNNSDVKHMWIKSEGVSAFVPNPNYVPREAAEVNDLREALIEDLRKYSPKFPKLVREKNDRSHLLVISPCDVHIGKLCSAFETGETYESQLAVQRVREGVAGLINKTQGFSIDKILFVGGNDILHIDSPSRTTTKGTPQDTSLMWHENFMIAKQLYVEVLESLLTVADVHFVFNPSNHDYVHGFFLANVVQTYFRNCPNITFDCSLLHRKGFRYFNNLIGTSHGDGAKPGDLPLLMAQEYSVDWAGTKHRYVYIHHLHHKIAKDYIGITVENLRSPSPADAYHHKHGYQHAPQAIEAFLHDKEHGQIARFNHIF